MKHFCLLTLPLLTLPALSGCMTGLVCARASTTDGTRVAEPGYYPLVPLTVVGDAVTLPIQACYHFAFEDSEYDPWRFNW